MPVFIHLLLLLFVFIGGIYFLYIAVHLVAWIKLPNINSDDNYLPQTKISIIISARNEEGSIGDCIMAISKQTYPHNLVELIIVDDHSADKTREIAAEKLADLKITSKLISNNEVNHGKKSAITEGIKIASGELIAVTDADCMSSFNWLKEMEYEYRKSGACMLCGPVCITKEKGFLGRFQSLELCGLSLLSGAGIALGIPLLCNGANMAYTRSIFNELQGFSGIDANPSGDDILFMFKVQQNYPGKIRYVKSKDAFTSTKAQPAWADFFSQRTRWASKGLTSNNRLNSLVSLFIFGVNILSVIAILAILVHGKPSFLLMYGLGFKCMADFLLVWVATGYFGKKKLLWIFPLAELFTMVYIGWIGITAQFSSYSWKGRFYKHQA